jgi:invasion protein IalB
MVQVQTLPGQANLASQITISRPTKNAPGKVFVQVPANVWLQGGVRFVFDDKEVPLLAPFRWCLPSRCLGDTDLNEVTVKKMRARNEPGRLEFKDAAQQDVSIPVSFKGFPAAIDLLLK